MKVYIVTKENVIKSIHTNKSFKEWWQHKLQYIREKVEGKYDRRYMQQTFKRSPFLSEICVGELSTPLVFICGFHDSTAYKTLQLPRPGEFPLNYFK